MDTRRDLGIGVWAAIFLIALAACSRPPNPARDSAGASATDPKIAVGSLVCPDTAAARAPSARDVPMQCPLLAVAVDSSGDSARLIGPEDREYRMPMSALKLLGPARLPEGLAGATDTVVERMAPGPNPGVMTRQSAFGLMFRNPSGTLDTVFPRDLPALQPADGGKSGDVEACLDALEASSAYGLLAPPFAPDLDCDAGSAKVWKWAEDRVVESGPSQGAGWKNPFSLKVLARPGPPGTGGGLSAAHLPGRRNWIFLLTGESHFIWRVVGGKARILDAPFMENSVVESVAAAEVDGDSFRELLVEVKTHDGDGFFNTLYVLKGGPQAVGGEAPRVGSIGLDGSSAEADGSAVESAWWIRAPFVYHAYAQAANPGGRGISHDTRLDAYRFPDSGGFARTEPVFSSVVYFGDMGSRPDAQALCDKLSAARPETAAAGMHPFPRLAPQGVLWQAGALAPDPATARRWAGWDPSGKVEKVSSAPERD